MCGLGGREEDWGLLSRRQGSLLLLIKLLLRDLCRKQAADKIKKPILLIHGGESRCSSLVLGKLNKGRKMEGGGGVFGWTSHMRKAPFGAPRRACHR